MTATNGRPTYRVRNSGGSVHVGRGRIHRRPIRLIGLLATLALLLGATAAPASANVRISPAETPFYAHIVGAHLTGAGLQAYRTDEWAAIPFYRPPGCVPADFNLLDFFDVPRVFGCGPMTVEHSTVWSNGPETDPVPMHTRSLGLGAVPVWFVSWPELEAAVADDEMTIGELARLPSLMVGSASIYSETLNPSGGALVPRDVTVAIGALEDGRAFRLNSVSGGEAGYIQVQITFR